MTELEISAEYLVAHGHALEQVIRYPLRQLYNFHRLAVKRHSKESLELMIMMRNVHHTEQKEFLKLIKTMEKHNG